MYVYCFDCHMTRTAHTENGFPVCDNCGSENVEIEEYDIDKEL